MDVRPCLLPAVLTLALLGLAGCNRRPAQAAQALNNANQTSSAPAPSVDPPANDTAPRDSSPVPDSQAGTASPAAATTQPATTTLPATTTQPAMAAKAPVADPDDASYQATAQPMIPAGTPVTVRLQQRLSSASAIPGQRFHAVVDAPVMVADNIVIPVGAFVTGHVVMARHSGRLHHPGALALTLDSVIVDQHNLRLATLNVGARGASHKKRNLAWIGGGTGGGALFGALAAGGRGALIGSGIGAVAGTTTALWTGKKDVTFGNERRLQFRLNRDVSLPG